MSSGTSRQCCRTLSQHAYKRKFDAKLSPDAATFHPQSGREPATAAQKHGSLITDHRQRAWARARGSATAPGQTPPVPPRPRPPPSPPSATCSRAARNPPAVPAGPPAASVLKAQLRRHPFQPVRPRTRKRRHKHRQAEAHHQPEADHAADPRPPRGSGWRSATNSGRAPHNRQEHQRADQPLPQPDQHVDARPSPSPSPTTGPCRTRPVGPRTPATPAPSNTTPQTPPPPPVRAHPAGNGYTAR